MIEKIFILSGLVLFSGIFSQDMYVVSSGDTAYSISKKHNISLEELYRLNPKLQKGNLKVGDSIYFTGIKNKKTLTVEDKNKNQYVKVVLKPKETLYSITRKYGISEEELKKLNPDLKMQVGEEIVLPNKKWDKVLVSMSDPFPTRSVPAGSSNSSEKEGSSPRESLLDEVFYEVQPRDTYYGLEKKMGISRKILLKLNPELKERGLQAGDKIRIRKDGYFSSISAKNMEDLDAENSLCRPNKPGVEEEGYIVYRIKRGDTVFGILHKYGISLDEFLKLNPKVVDGLVEGMVVRIKKIDTQEYSKITEGALQVAIMLPFGFNSGDKTYRSIAADFLTGAQLAIEQNVKRGLKMDVKIIDAGNESGFRSSLSQINQNNTDLIIGPLFKSGILDVLEYVDSQKIPVVSPFANSEDLYKYSNLVIMEPAEQVYVDRMIEEISGEYDNQKIYILADDKNGKNISRLLSKGLEKKLKNPEITIVESAEKIGMGSPADLKESPIMAILASKQEKTARDFIRRLNHLSQDLKGTKAYSLCYSPSFEKNSSDFSGYGLVYLMDRKINTQGDFEKEILRQYKGRYCKDMTRYAVIGFDVVNDILMRENKKGNLFKKMNVVQNQLATQYEFSRIKKKGAFVNMGFRVVRQ
ncbi:MAG: LysM peptidoglycan-binding domain-containing protein [Bergeyella sp.]|nr:LysM peptidoglycan-binding domain-containing protein [Bergeyella sp.]